MRKHLTKEGTKETPQSEPIPGREDEMQENVAGGYGFETGTWRQLRRFLFLGTESGTYYTHQRDLTKTNVKNVRAAINEDGERVVDLVREIAQDYRAPHQDPLLFTLALAISEGDKETRQKAREALPDVAGYSTHLFHFKRYAESLRGYGRALRNALARWYTEKDAGYIAYQAAKYPQRDGVSHADVLNVAHPKPPTPEHDDVFGWIVSDNAEPPTDQVAAMEEIAGVNDVDRAVELIREHRLTHEMVPSDLKSEPEIWKALLEDMPTRAMIRNLGNLTSHGVLGVFSDETQDVVNRLSDEDTIKGAGVHPLDIVTAVQTYKSGGGYRGSKTWDPVTAVVDALGDAFRHSFENVESTGKRILVAVDKSASMRSNVSGLPQLEAIQGALLMAMATVYAEDRVETVAFDTTPSDLSLSGRQRLDDVLNAKAPGGGTDVAAPFEWAIENDIKADAIVVYTDQQTWAGTRWHPAQAIEHYRNKINSDARVVFVDMTAEYTQVDDPEDDLTLGVVGFDSRTPQAINRFIEEG